VKLNCCPGPTVPEFHPLASEVDVCGIESVFVHVTVEPAATVTGLGLNAFDPSVAAPVGIATIVGDPDEGAVGDGATGIGEELDEDPLHAIANIEITATKPTRTENISSSVYETTATPLPCDQLRFVRLNSRQELDRLFDQRA